MSGKTNMQINFRIYVISHKIITNMCQGILFLNSTLQKKKNSKLVPNKNLWDLYMIYTVLKVLVHSQEVAVRKQYATDN